MKRLSHVFPMIVPQSWGLSPRCIRGEITYCMWATHWNTGIEWALIPHLSSPSVTKNSWRLLKIDQTSSCWRQNKREIVAPPSPKRKGAPSKQTHNRHLQNNGALNENHTWKGSRNTRVFPKSGPPPSHSCEELCTPMNCQSHSSNIVFGEDKWGSRQGSCVAITAMTQAVAALKERLDTLGVNSHSNSVPGLD